MNGVATKLEMLRSAREGARYVADPLTHSLPKLENWEACPTLRQLEAFASATHTPGRFLFIAEPPVESVPIPDFRTEAYVEVGYPSAELLYAVYLCQQRQDWYHGVARSIHQPNRDLVGSAQLRADIIETAVAMCQNLGIDLEERRWLATCTAALRHFIEHADAPGVLVIVSGVGGSNSPQPLDPRELRGITLGDPLVGQARAGIRS